MVIERRNIAMKNRLASIRVERLLSDTPLSPELQKSLDAYKELSDTFSQCQACGETGSPSWLVTHSCKHFPYFQAL